MEYHGFHTIGEYEAECARLGHSTRRVPFHDAHGGKFFALVSAPPGHPTGTSIESWTLFTTDETARVLDGIISGGTMDPARYMRDGQDVNWLGKLSASGYFPDEPQNGPAKPALAPAALDFPADADGQIHFFF